MCLVIRGESPCSMTKTRERPLKLDSIERPLKMMKTFLYHLNSSFRSQDIYIFVLTLWSCRKNGLIRNIRLISKFITSQRG